MSCTLCDIRLELRCHVCCVTTPLALQKKKSFAVDNPVIALNMFQTGDISKAAKPVRQSCNWPDTLPSIDACNARALLANTLFPSHPENTHTHTHTIFSVGCVNFFIGLKKIEDRSV